MSVLPSSLSPKVSGSLTPAGQQPNPKADKIQQLQAQALKETIENLRGRYENPMTYKLNKEVSTKGDVNNAKINFVSSAVMQACIAAAKALREENAREEAIVDQISKWLDTPQEKRPTEATIYLNILMGLRAAFDERVVNSYGLKEFKNKIIECHQKKADWDITGARETMVELYYSIQKILPETISNDCDPASNSSEWKWSKVKLDKCLK